MKNPRSIVITGASSGLGEALARLYAGPGVTLALGGRDGGRLEAVAEACRAAGATVDTAVTDVCDREALEDWILARDTACPVDLVIANAGVSGGTGAAGESATQVRRIMAINVDGVINTVLPLLSPMRHRGRGQVAIMSSLAGFIGFPGAPAYSAGKAAVKVWGEGLRGALAADGVGVTVICPGFVVSRMTDANEFPMPLLMSAERTARIIRRGLARNRARIAFPLPMYLAVRLFAGLPAGLSARILGRLPAKGSDEG